jgi:MFS family permease
VKSAGSTLAAPRAWRLQLPAVLQEPDFRRFWAGESVSMFGDQITLIALPLVAVLELHASAAQMGLLGAAALAPNLLFSLHAGAWVDRHGRRRQVMIGTAIGRAALLATIPVAYAFGELTLGQLYVVGFLTGALSVLFNVSYSTLFVSMVSRERYLQAGSLLHGSRAFSYVAGPSVGGALVQALSAPIAIVVDAVSFVVSALTLRTISPAEPPAARPEPGAIKSGARWIRDNAIVRSSLLATATINFFNFAFWALFILYVTRELGVQPGALGLVLGAGAVGGVLGAVFASRIATRIGVGPAFVLGSLLFPAPLVLVPLASGPRPVVLGCLFLAEFASGFGVMVLDINIQAIRAAVTPDRLRARVSGAYMVVNYGVRPIGSLVGGLLGAWIGMHTTLWISWAGATAGVIWLLPSPLMRLRELPECEE